MAFKNVAAVGNGEQKCFAEIECRMPADHQPEVSCAFKRQCEYQRYANDTQSADRRLPFIHQVHRTESERENPGRWPKADPVRKRKLQIAAEREFFKQTDQQEKKRPQ